MFAGNTKGILGNTSNCKDHSKLPFYEKMFEEREKEELTQHPMQHLTMKKVR